jgi:benzylsuccinate CoA-transferase BbsF subunit
MLLDGIRVLDFTWVGAGPLTTKVLADFGADVIKVESALRPDALRNTPPFAGGEPGLERSGYFANRNSSKRSIALNMQDPRAREIALRLAALSDVCAQSFRPGTMEHWGLGYDDLTAVRPDLVYLAMPMQGESGPHASYSGFGATLVALCGLYSLCGNPDRPPVGTGTNYPDHVPNPMHAAFAILLALRDRARTGRGHRIELSQLESTLNVLGPALLETMAGEPPSRLGNRSPYAAPHGVYPAVGEDRWVAISVLTDAQWHALVEVTGIERWRTDDSLRTAAGRMAQQQRIDDELAAWTASRTPDEVETACQARQVPAGVLQRAPEVLADPQLLHRGAFGWLDHPVIGRSVYTAPTMKLSRTPGTLRRAAPLLGEHTRAICVELLGMDETAVEELAAEGVLR